MLFFSADMVVLTYDGKLKLFSFPDVNNPLKPQTHKHNLTLKVCISQYISINISDTSGCQYISINISDTSGCVPYIHVRTLSGNCIIRLASFPGSTAQLFFFALLCQRSI